MIIYKVVQETVAAITSIKAYGVGAKSFTNERDQYDQNATSLNKYPLFWLYDVAMKPVGKFDGDFRYTCRAMILTQVTDETPDVINQAMQTTGYLMKLFAKSIQKHPAIRHDDNIPFSIDIFEVPPLGTDDRVVGWEIHFSTFLDEPGITCITPTTALEYLNDGYVDPNYV